MGYFEFIRIPLFIRIPPLVRYGFVTRGGILINSAEGRKKLVLLKFYFFIGNLFGNVFFAKEIAFSKRIISQFSRLRRAILQQCSIYISREYCQLKHFSNVQAAIAPSTHAQNDFHKLWLARWQRVISNLRAATALSTHAQNAS